MTLQTLAIVYVVVALLIAFFIFRKPSGWPLWLKIVSIVAWPLAICGFLFFLAVARGDQ